MDLAAQEKHIPHRGKEPLSLAEFSRDLTEAAGNDALDPLIGRDTEIERMVQILCRRTKNNPVLIGEPGVGKTAIAEGIAIVLANDEFVSLRTVSRENPVFSISGQISYNRLVLTGLLCLKRDSAGQLGRSATLYIRSSKSAAR